jgi:EAL domain-containing protein (putative c-di-GMP-specific phosphodiesterase class I)
VEEFGFIEQLTMQVVNKVMKDISQWKKEGIQALVWINLSAQLLSLSHLPQLLMRSLDVWNIAPAFVGFEITESAFIQDIDNTTAILFQLKECGFRLSIDDFGTGYSSLAYLRKFPLDEIKIDKMFVLGMSNSIQDKQIVQSIISLGHNFGLKVVAEGVEDKTTLDILEQMECDCIQGFLFSFPMPSTEVGPWYQNNPWKQHYQSKTRLNG